MKNELHLLAKRVLIPLELTAAASATNAGIYKKNLRILNNNVNNIKLKMEGMKIVQSLEDSGFFNKRC